MPAQLASPRGVEPAQPARLDRDQPVDAQAAVLKPNSSAFDNATDVTRSLNEFVGLRVSFFSHTSPSPSSSARRSARTSGVNPAPRSIAESHSTGSRSAYRQIESGPFAIDSRLVFFLIAS